MDRQATLDNALRSAETSHLGLHGLLADLLGLAELQWKLMRLDAREAFESVLWKAVMCIVAGLLLLGTIPVVLATVGYALVELAGWPAWAGFLTAALLGLAIAGGLVGAAYAQWRKQRPFFSRSASELEANLDRIKSLLHRPAR